MILSLYPTRPGCIHRRVCTGQAIPYTYLQMCGGLKIAKVSFGRTSSAGLLFFLVPGGHELFRSLQHPLVPRRPIVHLRHKGPYGSVNSECEPVVHRRAVCVAPNAWKSSLRQSIQFCSGRPLPGSSPPTSFPSISRFGRRPAGCLAMAPANRSRRCRMVASTLWHPVFVRV